MIDVNTIFITNADRRRLGTLVESARERGLAEQKLLSDLEFELERAVAVEPEDIPPGVVTMNSTIVLRDLDNDEEFEYTLVYPRDADALRQRVSVLAPVGTAILGCRIGDVIEWPVPDGKIRLRVEDVLYQPERAGDFTR